jgi:hypothetical protein
MFMGFSKTEQQQNREFLIIINGVVVVFLRTFTSFLHAIRLPNLKTKTSYLSEIQRRLKRYKICCLASSMEGETIGSDSGSHDPFTVENR